MASWALRPGSVSGSWILGLASPVSGDCRIGNQIVVYCGVAVPFRGSSRGGKVEEHETASYGAVKGILAPFQLRFEHGSGVLCALCYSSAVLLLLCSVRLRLRTRVPRAVPPAVARVHAARRPARKLRVPLSVSLRVRAVRRYAVGCGLLCACAVHVYSTGCMRYEICSVQSQR